MMIDSNTTNVGEADRLASTWALRAILHPIAFRRLSKVSFVSGEEDVLRITGLGEIINKDISPQKLYQFAKKRLEQLEKTKSASKEPILRNIDLLANMIGLNKFEKEVILFASIMQLYPGLKESVEYLGGHNIPELINHLSVILRIQEINIYESLKINAPLCSSGLIDLNRRRYFIDMADRLEVLDGLVHVLQDPHADIESALSTFFYKAPASGLYLKDFCHLGEDLSIFQTFMEASLKESVTGVNVLIYGPPGTGKTELVRAFARDLGVSLYEVSCQFNDGEPASKDQRFRSYLLCQTLFARRQDCLILFDEIEDVFPSELSRLFGSGSRSGRYKGWTNRLMERNQVPAIWISNCITQIDPAFLRRFDFILEVPVPPDTVRRQMLQKMLGGLAVRDEWLEAMGKNPHLAPGHMEKAIKVAGLVSANDHAPTEKVLTRVVRNLQKAMGIHPHETTPRHTNASYELTLLNTDLRIDRLIEVCRQEPILSVCLHGPSGTGKTAFVHYLGAQLQKKIIARKASEILDPYVGQTEQHLADMFTQAAEPDEAILFLDEADSFLQDRSRSRHSWEITKVNELLVQMENFEGLFICATNLMETLDNAVFRRFDLKVKFDFLKPEQAWGFFVKILGNHALDITPDQEFPLKSKLMKISRLTPADFLLADRQLRLTGEEISPNRFIALLERESIYKYGELKYPVGF